VLNIISKYNWNYTYYFRVQFSFNSIKRGALYSTTNDSSALLALFILGGICLLPGIYSLYHIIKAFRATNIEDRDRALEDVPE